jgi:hypothetical protein
MGNTLQLVLAALWLGVVLIYLLLTTRTQNKKLSRGEQMFFFLLGNGFNLVLFSVLCQVVR